MTVRSVALKKSSRTRRGRGFSRGELGEVGLDFQTALRLRIPIDQRRKTKHEENIQILKQHLRRQS